MNSINQPKSLEQRVRTIEGYIITISGPALCISGVVAGLDVVTNNFIRNYAPQVGITLGVIWAVCLMISLDFQVLVLGVRARRVYISNKGNGKKAFEMALAFAIALALGYVSLQMGSIFSRMMGTSLSMEQAVTQLGINPIWLVYERSAMVMLLIFMSGWLRDEEDQVRVNLQSAPQAAASISDDTMHVILTKLEKLDALELALQAPAMASLPEHIEAVNPVQTRDDTPVIRPLEKPIKGLPSEQNYGPRIEALYRENPEITVVEIEKLVGCSRTTAAKWLQRCKPVA